MRLFNLILWPDVGSYGHHGSLYKKLVKRFWIIQSIWKSLKMSKVSPDFRRGILRGGKFVDRKTLKHKKMSALHKDNADIFLVEI